MSDGTSTPASLLRENATDPASQKLDKLRYAVEQSPVAILIADTEGRIEYVSAGYIQQTGYSWQEMIGQSIATFEPEYTAACANNALWKKIESGGIWRGTVQSRRKNGTLYWETLTFSGITDANGVLIQLLLSKENVSRRKMAEEDLKRSEAFAFVIMESMSDALAVVDSRGAIIKVNQAWRRFTHEDGPCPHAAAMHMDIDGNILALCGDDSYFSSGEDATAVRSGLQAVLAGKLPAYKHEYLCRTRPKPRWFLLTVTPLALGQPGAVLSNSDITARKESELESIRYQDGLERMVGNSTRQLGSLAVELMKTETRERRSLAEDLHDDLGQQLTVLKLKLSCLDLPGQFSGRDELLEQLQEIESLVDRSTDSVRTISNHLSPPVLDREGLFAAMRWLCEEMLRTYGLKVHLHCDESMPLNETVNGSIYRTVRELLINVWKHANVDSATVTIHLSAARDMVEISVTDQGLGFDVVALQQPSSRLSFGIYSIRERMHLIGGKLQIDSAPGAGTRVTLQIPVRILNMASGTP